MIIYKTTNLINGKFYVGKDKKNNPNYLGSGKILKVSIKKYGKFNFKKEILEYCNSFEELNEREKFWISVLNPEYNIAKGGEGGDTISNNSNKKQIIEKFKMSIKKHNPNIGRKRSYDEIENWKKSYGDKWKGKNNPNFGSKKSEATKLIMSKKKKHFYDNLSLKDRKLISKKIGESNKGKPSYWKDKKNPNHSEFMKKNNPFSGKTHSKEVRKFLSDLHKGKPKSESHKKN